MTQREQRTVRYAVIGIAVYLGLFIGFRAWKAAEARRVEYRQLVADAQALKASIQRYDDKIAVTKKMMETFHMDPAALKRSTVIADASAALQRVAGGNGMQVSSVRETASRGSAKELGSIQFEAAGTAQGALNLLGSIDSIGFPVVIDSAQFSSDPMRPGQLKLKLTVLVLDFEQWKKPTTPHA